MNRYAKSYLNKNYLNFDNCIESYNTMLYKFWIFNFDNFLSEDAWKKLFEDKE